MLGVFNFCAGGILFGLEGLLVGSECVDGELYLPEEDGGHCGCRGAGNSGEMVR